MQNFKIGTFCGLSTSLLLASALLGPENASAEVVCVNDAANSRYACPAVFPATVGEFDQVLDFQQFRSSWGELTRVEVVLDAHITDAQATLTNTSNTLLQVRRFDMTSIVGLQGPSGTGLVEVIPVYSAVVPITMQAGQVIHVSGPGDPPAPSSIASEQTTVTGLGMTPYRGSGTVQFILSASPYDDTLKSQQITATSSTTTAGTATLLYYYTTYNVPEPTTVILIGSSLLGLALVGRNRFVKSS